MTAKNKLRVAVVGATGYTGAELIRILSRHPGVELSVLTARAMAGRPARSVFPHLGPEVGGKVLEPFDPDEIAARVDAAFLALPHGASAEFGAQLYKRGVRVFDLSADFRLRSLDTYTQWYGEHPHPELMSAAVYGLPELYREKLRGADLVAVPGCYPTATLLALAPLAEAGLISPAGVIADCKSGVSGAGRSAKTDLLFPEVGESFKAYAVGSHRHGPEIAQELAAHGAPVPVTFTPHLIPMSRGILATAYCDLVEGQELDTPALLDIYRARYADEPFVEVLGHGELPTTGNVRGSNRAQVTVLRHPGTGKVIALSAIDNLVKGAAGQAVQALNLRYGLDERAGLEQVALFP